MSTKFGKEKASTATSQTNAPIPRDEPSKRPASFSGTPNVFLAVLVAAARKVLFIEAGLVAIFYLALICTLSLIERYYTFDNSYYIVQKDSVLNTFGVKLGWFWTLATVGPFVWFSSAAHNRRGVKGLPVVDISRLAVGTFFWYSSVYLFHQAHTATSMCQKSALLSRKQCTEAGSVWVPGIDISGHCFLMLYSILVITEEAKSFRNYKQVSLAVPAGEREAHEKITRVVQYFFVAMFLVHVVWFKQMFISVIYYHHFVEEILGALMAVFCWGFTYRFLFVIGLLQPPINRKPSVATR